MIPWGLFLVLSDQIPHLDAGEQLRATQAVQHGYASARLPDDRGLRRATDELLEQAFPVVYEAPTPVDLDAIPPEERL